MFQLIREVVDREPDMQVLYECRRCGTSLQRPNATCPYCGTSEVATYLI